MPNMDIPNKTRNLSAVASKGQNRMDDRKPQRPFHGQREQIFPKGYVTPEKARFQAEMLANSVRKNFRHLSKRFKRDNIDCFRLYDWDSPDIRIVADWYAGHLVVAEYERIQTGQDYLPEMAAAAAAALEVPAEKVHVKKRHTNIKQGPRYKQLGSKGVRFSVNERDLHFWVNLDDYLDTGLYSDHRDTRVMIKEEVQGKDFLNLFAYTGAFTCSAAAGGARSTVTVDRSETYINWARSNMRLNGFTGTQHDYAQQDVPKYLNKTLNERRRFDVVFIDPPSFFKDQNARIEFDINRDHPGLLRQVINVTAAGGAIYFSTNHQRFEPHFEGLPVKGITDITLKTIPEDYRNKQVHRCWKLSL